MSMVTEGEKEKPTNRFKLKWPKRMTFFADTSNYQGPIYRNGSEGMISKALQQAIIARGNSQFPGVHPDITAVPVLQYRNDTLLIDFTNGGERVLVDNIIEVLHQLRKDQANYFRVDEALGRLAKLGQ